MKYAGIILLTMSILAWGCKKSSNNNAGTGTGNITGTWELREAFGSMSESIKYPAGNGDLLSFDKGSYTKSKAGQVVKNGQFAVVQDTTIAANVCLLFPTGRYTNRLIYDNNTDTTKIFFEVNGNKLRFYSGCYAYDAGHSEIYERVAEPAK